MTTATHQQNGRHWGKAKGSHGVQKPSDVGTAVRSTCQTWLGCLAVTTRVDECRIHRVVVLVFFQDPSNRRYAQMQSRPAQRLGDIDSERYDSVGGLKKFGGPPYR